MTNHGNTRHGHASRSGFSKEYKAWQGMIQRCTNVKCHKYSRYGGRGITVCDSWLASFENFLSDIGKVPSSSHSLDRIDNNGNYEPTNCRWATAKQQARNRQNTLMISGQSLIGYCEEHDINYHTVMTRIRRGASIEKAVGIPIYKNISKGAQHLFDIIKEIFPHQKIVREYNVADRGSLFLDFFLPALKLAFEYDGEFHFEYNEHFHGSRENFVKAKRRDAEKDQRCEEEGITLIRVAYNEEMSRALVLSKIEEGLDG